MKMLTIFIFNRFQVQRDVIQYILKTSSISRQKNFQKKAYPCQVVAREQLPAVSITTE